MKLDGGTAAEPRAPLPAALLLSLASQDLVLRKMKMLCMEPDLQPYAFERAHVYQARDVADLLRRAIEGFYSGHYCSKRDTRRHVYADIEALRAAYALAVGDE